MWSGPRSSTCRDTSTSFRLECRTPSRRCSTPTTLTPTPAIAPERRWSSPGRSRRRVRKEKYLPADVMPKRMTRMSSSGSMLPPETMTTAGKVMGERRRIAPATPTAAAGSTISLARSVIRRSPSAISSSVTVTTSSTSLRTYSKVRSPARLAARPSAIVEISGSVTTSPASRDRVRVAAPTGSTPTMRMPGRSSLAAAATPEIKPPPPMGPERLHPDDADAGAQLLGGGGDPRDQAPAPDGHDDGRRVRHLLQDLQGNRGLARDHVRVVEGMDHHGPALFREGAGGGVGVVVDGALQHHLGAVLGSRLHLGQRGASGHEHGGVDPEQRGAEGHALRVVAGAGGDDSPRALLGGQARDSVVGSSDLEGAGALEVLALQHRGASGHSREDPRRPDRGPEADL